MIVIIMLFVIKIGIVNIDFHKIGSISITVNNMFTKKFDVSIFSRIFKSLKDF